MGRLVGKITPFMVMDILAKARTMPGAVHMEVGEPDLPPSRRVQDAYSRAVRDKRFFYTPAAGLAELRERIAAHYLKRYNVSISPDRVMITPGTSGAFLVAFSILTDRDRRIVLPDPSYPCYRNFAYFLDTEPLFLPVGREDGYEIRPEAVRSLLDSGAGPVGALMVSSPSNPTGSVYGDDTIRGLVELAEEKGISFISDEIYHGLVYDRKERTALEFSDKAIVINGFSKSFCMPGFRLGWMILPEGLRRKAEIIAQNVFIAANTPAQYAALEAFDEDHLEHVRRTFRDRRDFLYGELKELFEIDSSPEGAFYIWADISRHSDDGLDFCRRLLADKAVAVTPGADFGSNRTAHYVRFAYTRDRRELAEGVKRIREFLGNA